MSQPTLCIIHEAVSGDSAIARVAMAEVRIALAAKYRVTVVAKVLDESLAREVEWLKLTVPPRLFVVKWTTARMFIKSALSNRRFDVVHSHQPQVASLSDVFTCHFLTRVAHERKCLESRPGARAWAVRWQQRGVLHAEDYFYRRWNRRTQMLFCSGLLRAEFARLYGMPASQRVLVNPCPPPDFADEEKRSAARIKMIGHDHKGPIVGFLGGVDERKGYRRLIAALQSEPDLFLLLGGPHTDGFDIPALRGRYRTTGLVTDVKSFYAACNAIVVSSYFDPCPLVVFEAAARGVPVIATEGVGNLPELLRYGAGAAWDGHQPLTPILAEFAVRHDEYRRGMQDMLADLSQERHARGLLSVYDEVLGARSVETGMTSQGA